MKAAFVDYRISDEELSTLENIGLKVIKCGPCRKLYDAISGHPDILLHKLPDNSIIIHKDTDAAFKKELSNLNLKFYETSSSLEGRYPYDVILNAISTPTHLIHNLKATDDVLLAHAAKMINLNVKQGYTKCSTAVLSDTAFMTSDKSIFEALRKENFDVLLLPPGDILLPGLDYGFIGGTCGMIDDCTMAFFGSLDYYPHKDEVKAFLKKHGITPLYLYDGPLIDRGSLITAESK